MVSHAWQCAPDIALRCCRFTHFSIKREFSVLARMMPLRIMVPMQVGTFCSLFALNREPDQSHAYACMLAAVS